MSFKTVWASATAAVVAGQFSDSPPLATLGLGFELIYPWSMDLDSYITFTDNGNGRCRTDVYDGLTSDAIANHLCSVRCLDSAHKDWDQDTSTWTYKTSCTDEAGCCNGSEAFDADHTLCGPEATIANLVKQLDRASGYNKILASTVNGAQTYVYEIAEYGCTLDTSVDLRWTWLSQSTDTAAYLDDATTDCPMGDIVYISDTVDSFTGYYSDYCKVSGGACGELFFNEDHTKRIKFHADQDGYAISEIIDTYFDPADSAATSTCPDSNAGANLLWG